MNEQKKRIILYIMLAIIIILLQVMYMFRDQKLRINLTGDLNNGTEQIKVQRIFGNGEPSVYLLGTKNSFAVTTAENPTFDLEMEYVKDSFLVFQTSATENPIGIDENYNVVVTHGSKDIAKNNLMLSVVASDEKFNGLKDSLTYEIVKSLPNYYEDDESRRRRAGEGELAWHGLYKLYCK